MEMSKSFRVPSILESLVSRQIRPMKFYQVPYEGEWISSGDKIGGVFTIHHGKMYDVKPLSLCFAKKICDGQILAVGDDNGFVNIFKTNGELPSMTDWYSNTKDVCKTRWRAHNYEDFDACEVFDICWTKDDTHILTASGDRTIRIWDIEAKRGVGTMAGHRSNVNSISVHPSQSEVLMSGSRDGCVLFWDMRILSGLIDNTRFPRCPKYMPVTKITDAHKCMRNAKQKNIYTKGVTSVLYLKDEWRVATVGANDDIVKLWDTRNLKIQVDQSPLKHVSSTSGTYGITSLAQDPTGTRLIASTIDSKIYLYDVMDLAKGEMKTFSGHSTDSYYTKACFSPDGTHILSGSNDHHGYIWKVYGSEASPTLLIGHHHQVTAVAWCPSDYCKVATCSLDSMIRVWNLKSPRFSLKQPDFRTSV